MEELESDLEYLSQPMNSAISGHEKSCSPQDCLNLNSIPHTPADSKRPLHNSFLLPHSPCHNLLISRKKQRVQKGTALEAGWNKSATVFDPQKGGFK